MDRIYTRSMFSTANYGKMDKINLQWEELSGLILSNSQPKISGCKSKFSSSGVRDFGWRENTNNSISSCVWKDFYHSLEVRAYWEIRCGFSYFVLALAEMKIIFLFALGAKKELITLHCFGCCRAELAQLSAVSPTFPPDQ